MDLVPSPTERSALENTDLQTQYYLPVKRAFDLVICLVLLPLVGALTIIIALLIGLDTPGWPIFVQERVGKDGRLFRLYKFRTMPCNHKDTADREFMCAFVAGRKTAYLGGRDAINKPITSADITRIGRFLRKSSLDELPQIVNVLRGEMSLIGPRPNVLCEVEVYQPWHLERLAVLPGITGLAQVHGRSSLTFEEIATYDVKYVKNLSWHTDMTILFQTIVTIFTGDGAL